MLFKEIIAVYSENQTKHVNTTCEKNTDVYVPVYFIVWFASNTETKMFWMMLQPLNLAVDLWHNL
jgi:hypothetical protein